MTSEQQRVLDSTFKWLIECQHRVLQTPADPVVQSQWLQTRHAYEKELSQWLGGNIKI